MIPTLPSISLLSSAQHFTLPLLRGQVLATGEEMYAHASATADILAAMGAGEDSQAAIYLTYACAHLSKPQETLENAFGPEVAKLALETFQLMALQRSTLYPIEPPQGKERKAKNKAQDPLTRSSQTENVRKMLLAFSRDLRVVVLRLASRLQTLRYFAASKSGKADALQALAQESLTVFAPLANRLGLGFIKWEIEDLSFRFLEPDVYKEIAHKLESKRAQREANVAQLVTHLTQQLKAQGIAAQVEGRAKHIYSIVKKMRGKNLAFHEVMDIRALRIITPESSDCYNVLAWLHQHYQPIEGEFDDYIARPKINGYQSLHTVVRDATGCPTEIQIRSRAMHTHAESGVAAHWAYKEAGKAGYAGAVASGDYEQKIALLRQLLAWERDVSRQERGQEHGQLDAGEILADRIYVLTPDARIIDLTQGATAIDFAYAVHTTLGHRCRGAKLDGVLVPLATPLQNGQTVEILAAKEGGPSRDWLNPDLGFLASARARAKVRAWFNAEQMERTLAKGREAIEKLLQREGKTSTNLEQLANNLGFKTAQNLFEKVGKEEFSLKVVEQALRPNLAPNDSAATAEDTLSQLLESGGPASSPALAKPMGSKSAHPNSQTVSVEGVDTLLTQLAKCCRPLPPEAIAGYVTRGKGISIHRQDCPDFQRLCARAAARDSGRILKAHWLKSPPANMSNKGAGSGAPRYPADIRIHALDRQGLLRDISELFAKEKVSLTRAQTQSLKSGYVHMQFTAEVHDFAQLQTLLKHVETVAGVQSVQRV